MAFLGQLRDKHHGSLKVIWDKALVLQRRIEQNRAGVYSASYGAFLVRGSRPRIASLKIRTSAAFRYQPTL